MSLTLREAKGIESVQIAKLLTVSLGNGLEANFRINRFKVLEHVRDMVTSPSGLALVALQDNAIVGCFMAEVQPHAYCNGYQAVQIGVYLDPTVRGGRTFIMMLDKYIEWAKAKPDVLFTAFSIGQLGPTTPYIRSLLSKRGFKKNSEDYYL